MDIVFPTWAVSLIVAFVAILGAFAVQRYVAFSNASKTFRAAVLAELCSIYPNPASWPNDIDSFLKARYTALQSAVENFRPFVPWWRLSAFNLAWLRYYYAYPGQTTEQCYHHYDGSYDPLTSNKRDAIAERNAIFYANVHRLLSFAKET